jgi:putative DNA primase/helicase
MSERDDYANRGVIDFEDLPMQAGLFALTDLGNAEYFAQLHGEHVRFDHRRKRWLLWGSHCWVADADGEIYRLAAAAMRARLRDAADLEDESARARAAKWAVTSEARSRVESMLWFAASLPNIADKGDRWDTDPWLLGVPNGVVDLRTSDLRPGRPEDGITMSTAVPYDAASRCPRWQRFLADIFDGDSALVSFLHRAIGYSISGDTSEQCLFLLYGGGANGKTTLVNTLRRILGDYAWNMPFATIEMRDRTAIPNDLAALVSRRFVTASETNDGTRLNEARIKTLTGCDPVTARFLHGEFFTFDPHAKFWLSVNHRPIVQDDSLGFWRRLRLIPFLRTFPVNQSLPFELAAEAPGVLAWAVEGVQAWRRDGLNPPAIVTEATRVYERDSDPLADFIEEACEVTPESHIGAGELYKHYTQWGDRRELGSRERLSSTKFGIKVSERFESMRTRTGKVYRGITPRTE